MTKSVLIALVLTSLFLGGLRLWFFDQPATDPVNIGEQIEQTQSAAEDSSARSRPRDRDVEAASLAISISPTAPAEFTDASSAPAGSASRFVQPTRGEQIVSAFHDNEQRKGLAISGRVQDEEGYPLASIEVLAEPIGQSDSDKFVGDQTPEAARSAWTDFDGSFVFGDLSEDEYLIRTAPMDRFAAAEITARAGEKSANLVLVWLQDVRLYGTVSSTKGAPLEDVRIIAGPPTSITNTDPKGDYEFDISVKKKSSPQTIHFRRDGYRDQAVRLDAADLDGLLEDYQLDVSMEPLKGLATVTGRLEDPDGRPVAGKTLNLNSSKLKTRYRVQSDIRGDFLVEGVEPGEDYRLSVRPGADYRDYEIAQLEIPASGLIYDIVLEPLGEGEVSGFLTDADGNLIPGFALTLHSKGATGQSVQVVSDHAGFFEVKGFPEGNAVLKTNSYPIFEIQGIRSSYEAEDPVRVVLDMGPHALRGRVMNGSGNPVAAPEVSLVWQHSENGVQNYSARKTTADQNGNFAFTGLGSGVHTLRVYASDFGGTVMNVNVGMDPSNVVVELAEES